MQNVMCFGETPKLQWTIGSLLKWKCCHNTHFTLIFLNTVLCHVYIWFMFHDYTSSFSVGII